jgi:glycosyltransferase involved in cell wall biosynthesis|tara:strand:+ start:277 stop:1224 length:948 start_codon:yes stop_codon:yes gene_type:complete
MDISVLIPLFNEEESLPELCSWIKKVMLENNYSYEVLLLDDGSKDNSWSVIENLSLENKSVKGVKFRRNYGKSAALNIGFQRAIGNVVITMDADLQDSPDEIPALYDKIIKDNYDLVSGWKQKRYDPISKTLPTKLFNWAARKASGIYLHDFNCGLKSYKNTVVKSIEVHGEMHRYIPVLAKWAGFANITEQVVEHQSRKYGETKFGLERFVNGFLDLMTITFVTRFGKKPMHLFGVVGTIMFIIGFILFGSIVGSKLYALLNSISAKNIAEMSSFYIALTSMIIGVQLFLAGFVSELISRNSNDRNNYHIEKEI